MRITLHVPDDTLEELRRRSREEGRSLNAVAVDALRRGLGRAHPLVGAEGVLGSFVDRPAVIPFDHGASLRDLDGIDTRGLAEALEWTRADR